jgi:hypothetical protein
MSHGKDVLLRRLFRHEREVHPEPFVVSDVLDPQIDREELVLLHLARHDVFLQVLLLLVV